MRTRLFFTSVVILGSAAAAYAAELRIVDGVGLSRAVKVVDDSSQVILVIENPKEAGVECVLSNVDGLASERRERISPAGECVFKDIAAGTWQVGFPRVVRWKVK